MHAVNGMQVKTIVVVARHQLCRRNARHCFLRTFVWARLVAQKNCSGIRPME